MRKSVALVLAVALALLPAAPAAANIPVIDSTNLAQNIVTAIETVDQGLTQVMQFKTQVTELDEIVRNGLAPAVYTWDRLVSISQKLRYLSDYRNWVGDLDAYLKRFGDLDYYRSARCYGSDLSCPESEWDRILRDSLAVNGFGSEARKKSLDDLMISLARSDDDLRRETVNLHRLQLQTQSARGQMEAIQTTNQLLNAAVQELMQIRVILTAQARAMAVQGLFDQTKQAQQQAVDERLVRQHSKPSPKMEWKPWPKGNKWR